MAARSVRCTLKNRSKHDLTLESSTLDHGVWSPSSSAPQKIAAGAEASWSTESDGFMTGTEGTAIFTIAGLGGKFKVWWNNPFCGKNHYSQTPEPAIPNYVAYDPQHPDLGHPYLLPDGAAPHVDGSDSTVLFLFDVTEPDTTAPADPGAAPAASPGATDTRVASAPAGTPTTVQCPAGFRKVVYAGVTSMSALAEGKDLLSKLSAEKVMILSPTTHAWVKNDEKFKQETPLINDAKRKQLTDLENANDVAESNIAGRPVHTLSPSLRILMLRALAIAFADADEDTNPKADPLSMRRLVISAHHCPAWTNRREDVLWGSAHHDSDADQILTLFKKSNGVLAGLAEIFPKAALHVEDLCFSACYTSGHNGAIPTEMFATFKNLATLWTYEGGSPSAQNAGGNLVTSSNTAIIEWEKASRPCGAIDAIDKASKDLRKIFVKRGRAPATGLSEGKSLVYDRSGPRAVTD